MTPESMKRFIEMGKEMPIFFDKEMFEEAIREARDILRSENWYWKILYDMPPTLFYSNK